MSSNLPVDISIRPLVSSDHERSTIDPSAHSNADRWFEDSNADVGKSRHAAFVDDDPPFYMDDESLDAHLGSPSVDRRDRPYGRSGTPFAHARSTVSSLPRGGSLAGGSEGFRSVIDDLTVENMRLKRRLRKLEKHYSPHLQREKLFEVRVHGLPPHQKRQLEATLQDFASSLDETPAAVGAGAAAGAVSPALETNLWTKEQLVQTLGPAPAAAPAAATTSASPTSGSNVNDSAYASMSTSQRVSSNQPKPRPQPTASARKQSKVHSYLHDIPAGLLPRRPPVMTEHSKKKLVVRKLEQLFTGRAPDRGEHSQPLQQQEVSNSAAWVDAGRKPWAEGSREARIMPATDEDDTISDPVPESYRATADRPTVRRNPSADSSARSADFTSSSRLSSPKDQRPTRPLDLDPQRAQVPLDNVDYIRHLGVSMPNPSHKRSDDDSDGWVYLNLLSNMAQLHIINVTSEFTKDAIMGYSAKLEMSDDGRMIRWKGGHSGTRMGSDSDNRESQSSLDGSSAGPQDDMRRRPDLLYGKATPARSDRPEGAEDRRVVLGKTKPENHFQYKPLITRRARSDDDDDFFVDEMDSLMSSKNVEDNRTNGKSSSGYPLEASGTNRSSRSSSRRRHDDGPIIYYNRAKFCTDLSGDRSLEPLPLNLQADYPRYTTDVVGCEPTPPAEARGEQRDCAAERPLFSADFEGPESMDVDGSDTLEDHSTELPMSSQRHTMRTLPRHEFDASGLGGVRPMDHFSITVQTRQTPAPNLPSVPISKFSGRKSRMPKIVHSIPEASMAAFRDEGPGAATTTHPPRVTRQALSTTFTHHEPSTLPPPSYAFFSLSSSSDDGDESSVPDQMAYHPSIGAHQRRRGQASQASSADDIDNDQAWPPSSDSSIDLLASAREIDPQTIAEREREFEYARVQHQQQLAEADMSTGSSAATAGEASRESESDSVDDSEEDSGDDDGDHGGVGTHYDWQ